MRKMIVQSSLSDAPVSIQSTFKDKNYWKKLGWAKAALKFPKQYEMLEEQKKLRNNPTSADLHVSELLESLNIVYYRAKCFKWSNKQDIYKCRYHISDFYIPIPNKRFKSKDYEKRLSEGKKFKGLVIECNDRFNNQELKNLRNDYRVIEVIQLSSDQVSSLQSQDLKDMITKALNTNI